VGSEREREIMGIKEERGIETGSNVVRFCDFRCGNIEFSDF
jgi:hypothetical protein